MPRSGSTSTGRSPTTSPRSMASPKSAHLTASPRSAKLPYAGALKTGVLSSNLAGSGPTRTRFVLYLGGLTARHDWHLSTEMALTRRFRLLHLLFRPGYDAQETL